MSFDIFKAAVLGVVEGMTEFLPVSSTGHLLLLERFLGVGDDDFGKTFVVLIQLGAILAILSIYFAKLWSIALGIFSNPAARRFVLGVLIAFLPAALVGAAAHSIIKGVLFNVWVVCFTLIAGGSVLLWVDQLDLKPRYHDATQFSLPMYLIIGIFQCFAMIPGVSRSGATILGALLMGVDRRTAAEFSFFLAIPTMLGATVLDLYKNWHHLDADGAQLIAVGFFAAFLSAALVVKTLVDFVGRYGFTPFGWYRIALGTVMLAILYL